MWLRAQTAYEKLKQYAQAQDAEGMQAMFVLYMTKLDAISQQRYVSWDNGGPRAPGSRVSSEALATRHAAV